MKWDLLFCKNEVKRNLQEKLYYILPQIFPGHTMIHSFPSPDSPRPFNRSWHISTTPKFFFDYFQTYTASNMVSGHLPCVEKSKFELEEKKFSLLLKREVCRRFCLENATFSNELNFFSSNSNFDFSSRDNSK